MHWSNNINYSISKRVSGVSNLSNRIVCDPIKYRPLIMQNELCLTHIPIVCWLTTYWNFYGLPHNEETNLFTESVCRLSVIDLANDELYVCGFEVPLRCRRSTEISSLKGNESDQCLFARCRILYVQLLKHGHNKERNDFRTQMVRAIAWIEPGARTFQRCTVFSLT